MKAENKEVPTYGFVLSNWQRVGYRATAHAYLKREGLSEVKHRNGQTYTLAEIEKAMIK